MRSILVILLTFYSFVVLATHLKGGEIHYDYLGSNNYRISVTIYRDYNSATPFDNPVNLTVFDINQDVVATLTLDFSGSSTIPYSYYPDFNCPLSTPDTCVEVAVYSQVIQLLPIYGGYTLAYQRCCISPLVINIISPDNHGFTFSCHIPGSEEGILSNNSPRADSYSPFYACRNEQIDFDLSATDPDGDSLVYSLMAPYLGADANNPSPNEASAPPYATPDYEAGFSATQPLGTESVTILDSTTGILTLNPSLYGAFLIGVKTTELRNGIVIGEFLRTFEVRVSTQFLETPDSTNEADLSDTGVYPNPTNDLITVKDIHPDTRIVLFSVDGSILLEQSGVSPLSLRHLPQGCYFLTIDSGNQMKVYKVVKQD